MLVGENDLAIVGGAMTVTLAFAVAPAPSCVVETCTELFLTPAVVPVTFMLKVQFELTAIVPPARAIEPAPAFAVIVPAPHVPETPGGVATTTPAGRVSVNAAPLRAVFALLFVIVNERLVEPFNGIVVAPNALEN